MNTKNKAVFSAIFVFGFVLGMALVVVIWEFKNFVYQAELQFDTRFSEPKVVLAPGYYKIQCIDGYVWLDIKTNGSSKEATGITLGKVDLADVVNGHEFVFGYEADSVYQSPLVSLQTGTLSEPSAWVDVGLKGRFLTKLENKQLYVLLNDRWIVISNAGPTYAGSTFAYQGRRYEYNPNTGDWQQIETTARPAK